MAGKSNRQQKKQQIFFRLTAFAGRRWRLVFSFESSGQVSSTNLDLTLIFHRGVSHTIRYLFKVQVHKAQLMIDRNCIRRRINCNDFTLTIFTKIFPKFSTNTLSMILGFNEETTNMFSVIVCSNNAF